MAPPIALISDTDTDIFRFPSEVVCKTHPCTQSVKQSPVLHRDLNVGPYQLSSASGLYLTLDDGRQVLDATGGGAAVSCIGHGRAAVIDAIKTQLERLDYCHSMFFSTPVGEELCQTLVESTGGKMSKALIVCSGSEAMEAATKLSRQYFMELSPPQPKRVRFIARKESYHGTTLGALSMSGHVARRQLYEPILSDKISHISPCNEYRGMRPGESRKEFVARLAQELDYEFQRVGPETVCAFVAEPVVGAALGCVPAVEGYFTAMKAVCDKYGALLILDEVMCGMGRTGTMHAWEQEDVVPDIQTMGKGLGGGYAPIAGLLIGHKVINALQKGTGRFSHGHTYQGHPVSCSAALQVQKVIHEENLLQNVKYIGEYLENQLRSRLGGHRYVGDIRGKGFFWGVEFVKDKMTKDPFDPKLNLSTAIHDQALQNDPPILVYPGTGCVDGRLGDHILISPPYNIGRADVDKIVNCLVAAVEDVFDRLKI